MNSDELIKWAENKYNQFLILLFGLLISIALPEKRAIAKVTILMLFLVATLAIIRQIQPGRWWLKFYTGLVFVNLILLGLQSVGALNIAEESHGQSVIHFILLIITSSQSQADFLHFSFVTLTTVGYGDIHPLMTSARIATDLEAIAGVMYPAILISRLVSLDNTKSQESV